MVRRGAGCQVGVVVLYRRIHHRQGPGDQFSGARDIGLAAGAGEEPVETDAPLGRTWSRKRLMSSSGARVIVRNRIRPLRR
jgi:hypothetical protein